MSRNNLPHFIVSNRKQSKPYQSVGRGGGRDKRPEISNKSAHVNNLIRRFDKIQEDSHNESQDRKQHSLPARDGVYIQIRSFLGHKLAFKKLELKSANIRLLYFEEVEEDGEKLQRSILYIPYESVSRFLDRLNAYKEDIEKEKKGSPSQRDLVEFISSIKAAVLEQFWRDPLKDLPSSEKSWVELWIWTDDLIEDEERNERLQKIRGICERLELDTKEEFLHFVERSIMMIYANEEDLSELLKSSDYIAEFRLAKSTVKYIAHLELEEQKEWVDDLLERMKISDDADDITVTILDTGVNNKHPLLKDSLQSSDRHTINISWTVNDHSGHGTEMAGLALFQNLKAALESNGVIEIGHVLESSKFLPPRGNNPKELYGDYTKQAVSLASLTSPSRKRIINMSVTASEDIDRGRPSSWSAAVDDICQDEKVVFIVSAGNNRQRDLWKQYPLGNLLSPVQDPGQSWNAITVGAYTQLCEIKDEDLKHHNTVAGNGQLSPYSSTGHGFESQWPVKPDVLFEGGNLSQAPDGFLGAGTDDLSLLTTAHNINVKLFNTTWATSASAAQLSAFAARLQRAYPDFWGETIRGLIIHSAEWTDGMINQFDELGINLSTKGGYQKALKIFGYGAPSFQKAVYSADNSLTLLAQADIQPFIKERGERERFNELHIYELPWPREILLGMGSADVELKVTLSYYIEPMPGERGNKDKYKYASHQLEFQVNKPGEGLEEFSLRMGEKLKDEDYQDARKRISHSENRWVYGVNSRNSGSIHSDKINSTAAEISDCNLIAVYPKTGWWYTRTSQQKLNNSTRYSLIVSLSTPEEDIDLYTSVETQIDTSVEVNI